MKYDYQDADGFERGEMGKGKPKAKLIYTLKSVDEYNKTAHLESNNAWGGTNSFVHPLHTVSKLETPIERR